MEREGGGKFKRKGGYCMRRFQIVQQLNQRVSDISCTFVDNSAPTHLFFRKAVEHVNARAFQDKTALTLEMQSRGTLELCRSVVSHLEGRALEREAPTPSASCFSCSGGLAHSLTGLQDVVVLLPLSHRN